MHKSIDLFSQVSLTTLIMGLLLLCNRARVVDYTSEYKSTTHALVHKRSRTIMSVMSNTCVCPMITPLWRGRVYVKSLLGNIRRPDASLHSPAMRSPLRKFGLWKYFLVYEIIQTTSNGTMCGLSKRFQYVGNGHWKQPVFRLGQVQGCISHYR